MPTLLVNKEVGTQMWPSIQLSDDLGGVVEHVSVAWPGYPGCRHVPCSPQTSCLLSASPASRWDLGGRNFGVSKPEGVMVGRCVPEHAHRAPAWAVCRASGYLTVVAFTACVRILDSHDPTASSAVWVLARVPTGWTPHLFMWSLPQHCLQTRGSLATRRQQECLSHIILLYSEMAFNLQIFTLQVARRLKSVSVTRDPWAAGPHQ